MGLALDGVLAHEKSTSRLGQISREFISTFPCNVPESKTNRITFRSCGNVV
jgi:hypothetical protein